VARSSSPRVGCFMGYRDKRVVIVFVRFRAPLPVDIND
jgi:hypothetical protein